MTTTVLRPTTLEIDLDAAAHNVRAVRQLVGPERNLFAVIRARHRANRSFGNGIASMRAPDAFKMAPATAGATGARTTSPTP
jgi:hypothetical protein